jgi:hypothetical protein
MEPTLPLVNDATNVISSEDAEHVVDHGIQAGFVGTKFTGCHEMDRHLF